MGQAPASNDCNKAGIGTPFVKAGEFGSSRPLIREWTTDPKKFARSTDVLICVVGATCGKINLGADCAIGRSAAAIRPNPTALDQFYLCYFLEGSVDRLRAGSQGAAQTVISKEMLASVLLPLPPLDEQRRIVAVLDEAFEGLARARENAEANLQNARELFESVLEAALEALANQHGTTRLESVCEFRNGFVFKSALFKPRGEPVVRISNIQEGEVDETKMVFTDPTDYLEDLTKYAVQPGDLLIAMSGATTGKVGFNTTGKVLLQNQRVGRFCPTDKLDLRFLYYFLVTKVAENLAISAGAAQPNLSTRQINEIEMPFPSLGIQEEFVQRITILRDAVEALRDNYTQSLHDLDDLRQSLLQKAFAGELT